MPGGYLNLKETDLHAPVYELLKNRGYLVRSEVNGCDMSAIRDEQLVIVELKINVNLKLLIQATDRLSLTPLVYIAVPEPTRMNAHWKGTVRLLKMLELGLILVSFGPTGNRARVEFNPHPYKPAVNRKKSNAVLKEALGRSGEYNIAGSTRKKLVTTYRENAIYIACCLQNHDSLQPRQLRAYGSGDKTQQILSKNHYGWFEKAGHGRYRLSEKGSEEIEHYPEIRDKAYSILGRNDIKRSI